MQSPLLRALDGGAEREAVSASEIRSRVMAAAEAVAREAEGLAGTEAGDLLTDLSLSLRRVAVLRLAA